ncbi:uncharacterized protein LOC125229789 [Leguminivora glycinivorella]|uniref:uncharacterized protein LOC125229789 n=1 Tax=Leguminivora glycinivorella TaxID=1035111 RepID=UPI002010A74B|nr:uncharacterized protein LOC125229789 [Leguminivora glycinivorella]
MKHIILLAVIACASAGPDPATEMEWKAEYGTFGLNYFPYFPYFPMPFIPTAKPEATDKPLAPTLDGKPFTPLDGKAYMPFAPLAKAYIPRAGVSIGSHNFLVRFL